MWGLGLRGCLDHSRLYEQSLFDFLDLYVNPLLLWLA